jgi:hypothetical protein
MPTDWKQNIGAATLAAIWLKFLALTTSDLFLHVRLVNLVRTKLPRRPGVENCLFSQTVDSCFATAVPSRLCFPASALAAFYYDAFSGLRV